MSTYTVGQRSPPARPTLKSPWLELDLGYAGNLTATAKLTGCSVTNPGSCRTATESGRLKETLGWERMSIRMATTSVRALLTAVSATV